MRGFRRFILRTFIFILRGFFLTLIFFILYFLLNFSYLSVKSTNYILINIFIYKFLFLRFSSLLLNFLFLLLVLVPPSLCIVIKSFLQSSSLFCRHFLLFLLGSFHSFLLFLFLFAHFFPV